MVSGSKSPQDSIPLKSITAANSAELNAAKKTAGDAVKGFGKRHKDAKHIFRETRPSLRFMALKDVIQTSTGVFGHDPKRAKRILAFVFSPLAAALGPSLVTGA